MLSSDTLFVLAQGTALLFTVVVLSYYLTRLMIINKRINEASDIVRDILNELRNRLNEQNHKILDLKVKIDILELRTSKIVQMQEENHGLPTVTSVTQPAISQAVGERGRRELTEVEFNILGMLKERPYSATEISRTIGRSREHTARVMKKLFEEDYIYRNEGKKPYKYRLRTTSTSEAG